MKVTLYTTLGCHLCELAHHQLEQLQSEMQLELELVDIANADHLIDAYGIRIPVVSVQDNELGWPFELSALRDFLNNSC